MKKTKEEFFDEKDRRAEETLRRYGFPKGWTAAWQEEVRKKNPLHSLRSGKRAGISKK
jgi:hypothetical protein